MKHRILVCSLILVLACIVRTMSNAGLTAFLPDILNGHYSMSTAFLPDIMNGYFSPFMAVSNGHYSMFTAVHFIQNGYY